MRKLRGRQRNRQVSADAVPTRNRPCKTDVPTIGMTKRTIGLAITLGCWRSSIVYKTAMQELCNPITFQGYCWKESAEWSGTRAASDETCHARRSRRIMRGCRCDDSEQPTCLDRFMLVNNPTDRIKNT